MDNGIEKLIASLESEIRLIDDASAQEQAKLRLERVAASYKGEDKIITSLELLEEIKNRPVQPKILSGFKGLDSILDGFRPKQLVILSGITKHGKTSFAMELTERLKDLNPVWFPFEESAEELIYKFLERGQTPPRFLIPQQMKTTTLDWIEQKLVEAKVKYDSKFAFIDHLHFIVGEGENLENEIGKTVRGLRKLATRWDTTIVLLVHVKKVELDKHPNLEDLKGSSSIAQEADTVLFLWRETVKGKKREVAITNNVNLSVQANRRTGKTGNIKMVYENGRFIEQEWDDRPDPFDGV